MPNTAHSRPGADRAVGICLCIAAAATALAMAHHPSGAHQMRGDGGGDLVHGAMLVLLAVIAIGLFHAARRRGSDGPGHLAAVVAYSISLGMHLGAGTINGFVVPALMARGPDAVGHNVFLLAWEMNQAMARIGVYATGAAFVLWSVDFLRLAGVLNRVTGIVGVLAGIAPAAALFGGAVEMNVRGAGVIYAAHAGWVMLVGVQLIRRDA